MATITIANSRLGSVRMMSISRMMAISTMPRKNPAISPSAVPISTDSVTTASADEQRQARAENEAREHVAADGVGAERMGKRAAGLPERRQKEAAVVGEDRRIGRNEIGGRGEEPRARR